jgi:RNA polymerase sigma-70 factor (ECF subfamily)
MARSDDDAGDTPDTRFETLYREHAPRLQRRLRAKLRSAEDAKDMVQDAFARLVGARTMPHEPAAFLNRIVRNLVIDRARRLAARSADVPLVESNTPAVDPSQSEAIELAQIRARYRRAVGALPNRTREVFILHRIEGLSYKDIAARLAISPRTVEWHIAEAIVRIGRDIRQ